MRSPKNIVIASRNRHKVEEISYLLKDLPVQLLSLIDFPEIPEIEETGKTFVENALIKARTVYEHTRFWVLSDDSGLEVDALNGAPGVYSARYAGSEKDYAANNRKLLRELQGVPEHQRGAQFRCVAALVTPELEETVEGIVRGMIIFEERGKGGFGYDPLFVPEERRETYAEMSEEMKNAISHRARAFAKAKVIISGLL